MQISFPLDDTFFRRECPYCIRQYKIEVPPDDLRVLAERLFEAYATGDDDPSQEAKDDTREVLHCPYCGQQAGIDEWWTSEQLAYAQVMLENLAADAINKAMRDLQRNLRPSRSGLVSIKANTKEMSKKEPWISPEDSSMTVFDLACCGRRIKVLDDWDDIVYCVHCGFPHAHSE
ncbi:MAG: hypothetical protein ACYC5M_10595 [Anaerolineae bacterium]